MKLVTQQELPTIAGGFSKDDILGLSVLYGCVAGTVGGMVMGGCLGYGHVLFMPIGIILGGLIGIPFGIAGGILYGIPLASSYGNFE